MSMDRSVYDGEKREVLEMLQVYEKVEMLDCVLFIIDEDADRLLSDSRKMLELEYGYDKDVLKKYSLAKIVNYLNDGQPTNTYSLSEKKYWRQINDPEKVKKALDAEFVIWKNSLLSRVTSAIKAKGLTDEKVVLKREDLQKEIELAALRLAYVKEHFDELDVRISSFFHRPSFGILIRFRTIMEKRERKIRLKNSIPNVLFMKKIVVDVDPQNELIHFFKDSTNAFGDVYYK